MLINSNDVGAEVDVEKVCDFETEFANEVDEDDVDDDGLQVFKMWTEIEDWVCCCWCCSDEVAKLISWDLLLMAKWFGVEDEEDGTVETLAIVVEDVVVEGLVGKVFVVEALVLVLALRCDSLGIWNFEFNPFMKPSILAAIIGEAYCKIFIISAWWSKRVAGWDVEADEEEFCDDGNAGDVDALWDFFDDLRISEKEFVLWLLERP